MGRLTAADWEYANRVCTRKQLDALDLWRKDFGYKRIAFVLHIHPTTAKARVEAGLQKLGLSVHHFAA